MLKSKEIILILRDISKNKLYELYYKIERERIINFAGRKPEKSSA